MCVARQICCWDHHCQASTFVKRFCYFSEKTRDMSFLFRISLALFILKRRREQKTHVLGSLRELLVPTWYTRRTSSPTSPKTTRTNLRGKASLMQRTSRHILPTSRRILITGRDTNHNFGSTAQNYMAASTCCQLTSWCSRYSYIRN